MNTVQKNISDFNLVLENTLEKLKIVESEQSAERKGLDFFRGKVKKYLFKKIRLVKIMNRN